MVKDPREQVVQSAARLRAMLEDLERLVRDPAARPDQLNRLQQRIMVQAARQTNLVAQIQTGRAPTPPDRPPATGARSARPLRPMRESVLDALNLIEVPASPRALSDIGQACFQVELPVARFASLRRDEERAWQSNPTARPAWVVPAISCADYMPLARLASSSAWPLERRLIGVRTQRVNHLQTLLALVRVWERTGEEADGAQPLRRLVLTYARSVPGALPQAEPPSPARIRAMAQAELEMILPADLAERRAAAAAMQDWPPQTQLWGQTGPRPLASTAP
jgi:hypothetical protein